MNKSNLIILLVGIAVAGLIGIGGYFYYSQQSGEPVVPGENESIESVEDKTSQSKIFLELKEKPELGVDYEISTIEGYNLFELDKVAKYETSERLVLGYKLLYFQSKDYQLVKNVYEPEGDPIKFFKEITITAWPNDPEYKIEDWLSRYMQFSSFEIKRLGNKNYFVCDSSGLEPSTSYYFFADKVVYEFRAEPSAISNLEQILISFNIL